MRWATRAGVHIDRAACAWLIRRFLDPEADSTSATAVVCCSAVSRPDPRRSDAHHHRSRPQVTVHVSRSRMRAFVQIVGGVVLGLGLAATVGLDPGLLFAGYALGLGVTLLRLGLLLPEDPDAADDRHDHSCPRHR